MENETHDIFGLCYLVYLAKISSARVAGIIVVVAPIREEILDGLIPGGLLAVLFTWNGSPRRSPTS